MNKKCCDVCTRISDNSCLNYECINKPSQIHNCSDFELDIDVIMRMKLDIFVLKQEVVELKQFVEDHKDEEYGFIY
jgi:hypothetical protein